MIRLAIFIMVTLFFNACNSTQTIMVSDTRSVDKVSGEEAFLIKTSESKEWEVYPYAINGFDFQTGNIYTLQVKENSCNNSKNRNYSWVSTVSKLPTTTNPATSALNHTNMDINNTWEVTTITDFEQNITQKPYFTITPQKINGNTGCNQFGGEISFKDNTIKIGNLMMTKMFCVETAALEQSFLNALERTKSYQINGKELLFFDENKNLLIISEVKSENDSEKNNVNIKEAIINGDYSMMLSISTRGYYELWDYKDGQLNVKSELPVKELHQYSLNTTDAEFVKEIISEWDFNELSRITPPSNAHQYDGDMAVNFSITVNDKVYTVPTFDYNNPPKYIKVIFEKLKDLRKK